MKKITQNPKSGFSLSRYDYVNDFPPKEKVRELIKFLQEGVEDNFKLSFYHLTDYDGCFEGIDFYFYEVIEESEEEYQKRIRQERLEIKITHEKKEYKLYQKLKEKYER